MIAAAPDVIGLGELAVAFVGMLLALVFGIPAWRVAKGQVHRERTQELAESMARYLGIPLPDHPSQPIPRPDPEHPTLIDLLTELRDNSTETAAVSAVVAHHISDGHGRPIPASLLGRIR